MFRLINACATEATCKSMFQRYRNWHLWYIGFSRETGRAAKEVLTATAAAAAVVAALATATCMEGHLVAQ